LRCGSYGLGHIDDRPRLPVVLARRLVVFGHHALLISDVVAMLSAAPIRSTTARTDGRPHNQTGCGAGSRIVVVSPTHGRAHCCAQYGSHYSGADSRLTTRIRPQRLLCVTPAVLVFCGKKLKWLARGRHHRHARALRCRYASHQADQAGWQQGFTPMGNGCLHCGAPSGVAGTVFQPPGHDAT